MYESIIIIIMYYYYYYFVLTSWEKYGPHGDDYYKIKLRNGCGGGAKCISLQYVLRQQCDTVYYYCDGGKKKISL